MGAATLTDAELVGLCRDGDPDAWRAFVERFSRYVFAICMQAYRLTEHEAEDVFQEVFARTYERLGELRDPRAVRPWLAQLTRRLCVDTKRAAARETPTGDGDLEPAHVDETLATLDDALSVRGALDGMPLHCREVLDRFFCRDESYREIGAALDIPSGTIASRISRCLRRLRDDLEGRTDAPAPSRDR